MGSRERSVRDACGDCQAEDRMESRFSPIPLLTALSLAPSWVGRVMALQMVSASLARWRYLGRTAVIAVLGEPTAGKSTLSSEITALAAQYTALVHVMRGEPVRPGEVKYVGWEFALHACTGFGLIPNTHTGGKRTPADYACIDALFLLIIAEAIQEGGLVVLESPALVSRGDASVWHLSRRAGALVDLPYDLYGIWLVPTPALAERGMRTRERFAQAHADKIAALSEIAVKVEAGPLGARRISGGLPSPLVDFYADLHQALYTFRQSAAPDDCAVAAIDSAASFGDPLVRSRFLISRYVPYLLLNVFGFSTTQAALCENDVRSGLTLYQSALDAQDYVKRLQASGRLAELCGNVQRSLPVAETSQRQRPSYAS